MRRINLSAAAIVVVCFFLPWVQVSCAGAKDTLSGLSLARHEDQLLWLVPLMMCAVLVFGLVRIHRAGPQVFGILSALAGVVVLLLMNRERGRVQGDAGLIPAQLTGWFWLAFISAVVIVASSVALFLRRRGDGRVSG